MSEICTGGTRKPISEERWRRSERTRFNKLAALLLVDQRNQLESDLEGEIFKPQQRGEIGGLPCFGFLFLAGRRVRVLGSAGGFADSRRLPQ